MLLARHRERGSYELSVFGCRANGADGCSVTAFIHGSSEEDLELCICSGVMTPHIAGGVLHLSCSGSQCKQSKWYRTTWGLPCGVLL